MNELFHALLGPVRRRSYRRIVSTSTITRPQGAPRASAPGPDADRVLVYGHGPAAGWGVASHDEAMPGHLARRLSEITGRGADVDLVIDLSLDWAKSGSSLGRRDLTVYDGVVITLGTSDAFQFTSGDEWGAALVALIEHLEESLSAYVPIAFIGVQPLSALPLLGLHPGGRTDRHAQFLNEITESICRTHSRTHYLAPPETEDRRSLAGLADPSARHRSAAGFARWAQVAGDFLGPLLNTELVIGHSARAARATVSA